MAGFEVRAVNGFPEPVRRVIDVPVGLVIAPGTRSAPVMVIRLGLRTDRDFDSQVRPLKR
jgi:hypothetical protein